MCNFGRRVSGEGVATISVYAGGGMLLDKVSFGPKDPSCCCSGGMFMLFGVVIELCSS
jgi:hypothetical protein